MTEDLPAYKVAIGPQLQAKIPYGDAYWSTFNAAFQNVEWDPIRICAALYEGHPITTWHKDHWRHSRNYLLGQHIGIDFDTGDERSSVKHLLADHFIARYASIVYTTPSHTDAEPRARAIFLLDTPIHQAANYTLAATALLWLFGTADRQCKDAVRFFYGGKPGACRMEWLDNILPLALVRDLIQRYQATGQTSKHTVSHPNYVPSTPDQAEITDALRVIPPWSIDYDQWVGVLMAIHSAYPDATGLSMAEAWADGKKGEVAQKWRSFKSDGNPAGKVTVASLFGLAMNFGYTRAHAG